MATFKFEGTKEYEKKITILHDKSEGMIKQAVYPGAGIVADAVRAAIEQHNRNGDLAASMTLVSMKNDNGYINTKINFADYDRNGVPNALKAAVLESGSSQGHPKLRLITKAANGVKDKAYSAMSAKIDELIQKTMEG